ncbi:MAG TPA: type II toxin-antitoxin system PemK/MazF family toxin [Puia sp.]|nr:type II toxin-antitoxin system PemK/MazF family toxin [Puia sp.]
MKPGDIVLTGIPQDKQQKIGPVLVLKILPKYNDLPVCAVSSQLHQHIADFDIILENTDPAFASSGLKTASVFRLANLAVLPKEDIIGIIGFLQKENCMKNY